MTSAIVSATIDDAFPVAGVDNDSQGFRDNFNVIKTGLATAASEISDLQTNAARKDVNNDFDGNIISNAVTSRVYGSAYQTTITGSSGNISLNDGEYQQLTINNNCILTFTNWPEENQYGKIRLELRSDGISSSKEVQFSTESAGVVRYELGALTSKATGAHRNSKGLSATSTEFSFPTGNITSGSFQPADFLYGTGLRGSVSIVTVTNLGAANANATVAPIQINYSNISVGAEVVVTMAASIATVTNGDPITLSDTTGLVLPAGSYYAFKNGGNIKVSTTPGSYTAITTGTGTYTGNNKAATFALPVGPKNYTNITVGAEVILTMADSISAVTDGDPVTLTDTTGLTGINTSTTYYAFKNGSDIKLSSSPISYTAITTAIGTYTGNNKPAGFPLTGNSNRVTLSSAIASSMYVNMPIVFTGTSFGGIAAGTYFVHSIIDSTGIRLKDATGTLVTMSGGVGTLAITPRTVLTTSFPAQPAQAAPNADKSILEATNLTLTVNSAILPDQKLILDADNSKVKIIEAWKRPYSEVGLNIVYLKYIGEFG